MIRTALLLLMTCAAILTHAAEGRVQIVLDASGSMWGQIDGRSKIEIAREAFDALMQTWPEHAQLGLTAYGHRRKGDCEDIEILFSLGDHQPQQLAKSVQRIKPKGKTPLYHAVLAAAQDLDFKQQKATVILLSDGLETCHDDPCGALKQLTKQALDLKVHVIGFDVSVAEAEQLHCMASATGGSYFSAQDAAQLADVLRNVVVAEVEPITETLGDASIQVPAEVVAGSLFDAAWQGPNNPSDRLVVMKPGAQANDLSFHYAYTTHGTPAKLKAPDQPGDYEVVYLTGQSRTILARAAFKSTPPQVQITAPASVTAGSQFVVEWQGPGNPGETLRIFPVEAEDDPRLSLHYTYANPERDAVLRAPTEVGTYEIRYVSAQSRSALARTTFEVTAAQALIQIPATIHAGEQFEVNWQGPANSGDRIGWPVLNDNRNKLGDQVYVQSGKNPIKLIGPVEPGTYRVQYLNHKREVVAEAPFQVLEANASVNSVIKAKVADEITVVWSGPKAPGDLIEIYGSHEDRYRRFDYVYATPDKQPATLLVPSIVGDYEIRYLHGRSKTPLAAQPLRVQDRTLDWTVPAQAAPSSPIKITLAEPGLQQARVLIMETGKERPKQLAATYASGKSEVTLIAPKAPGTYRVVYQIGKIVKRDLAERSLQVE